MRAVSPFGPTAGLPSVNSQVWNREFSGWPEMRSASAMNSGIRASPPFFYSSHVRRMVKNASSPTVVCSACTGSAPRS